MTKQELLKLKIEIALSKTAIEALLYSREKMTWSEVQANMKQTQEDLYKAIARMEPTHESEVV